MSTIQLRLPTLYHSIIFNFKEQMLQAGNTELFNLLVPKARNSECQIMLLPLRIKQLKVKF